jgi:hypothetical protein
MDAEAGTESDSFRVDVSAVTHTAITFALTRIGCGLDMM